MDRTVLLSITRAVLLLLYTIQKIIKMEKAQKKDWNINISEMKKDIIKSLSELAKGYGKRKSAIVKDTGIPIDILTVLLKQLKIEGKIELIMIWCEEDSRPNGSGYCLTGNLIY